MSVRFDTSSEYLYTASVPSASEPLTFLSWIYISVDTNAAAVLMLLLNGAGDMWHSAELTTSGTQLLLGTTWTSGTGTNLTTGVWVHVARVRSGSNHYLHLNAVQDIGPLDDGSPLTPGYFLLGGNGAVGLNGRIAYARLFTAALNTTQIAAERDSATAVLTGSLWADWPLASDYNDASGNGRHLSAVGTLAFEAQPTLGGGPSLIPAWWVRRRAFVIDSWR